jgi:peptidyl-tRNA hydrolase, PTH1 family
MGLFIKKTEVGTHMPVYTTSANKTVVLVGLGNPGKEYKDTRHNIGFEAIDEIVEYLNLGSWTSKKDLKCEMASAITNGVKIIAVKPTTFMNNSGEAVQAVLHFYKLNLQDVLVIHDELDIDFGRIRTSVGGSAAGHNGIKSIIAHVGEDFGRLRIGIGPKKPARMDSADFVLGTFSAAQSKEIPDLLKESISITSDYLASGQLYVETRTVIF